MSSHAWSTPTCAKPKRGRWCRAQAKRGPRRQNKRRQTLKSDKRNQRNTLLPRANHEERAIQTPPRAWQPTDEAANTSNMIRWGYNASDAGVHHPHVQLKDGMCQGYREMILLFQKSVCGSGRSDVKRRQISGTTSPENNKMRHTHQRHHQQQQQQQQHTRNKQTNHITDQIRSDQIRSTRPTALLVKLPFPRETDHLPPPKESRFPPPFLPCALSLLGGRRRRGRGRTPRVRSAPGHVKPRELRQRGGGGLRGGSWPPRRQIRGHPWAADER